MNAPLPAASGTPLARWRTSLRLRLEASDRYPRAVLFAVLAGIFATSFPFTILAVSLAPIAEEFGARETTLAWVVTAPMLVSAVAFPLVGKLGDVRGHRRVFLVGFAAATFVALLTALAWGPFSLIGFRTVAAVLGSATQPTAMALLFAVYPAEGRVRAMGWWSMTMAAAPALGLILGGPLIDSIGWRSVFVVQAALSVFALAGALVLLPETERTPVRFDVPGALTLSLGVGGLMVALGFVRELGFDSPWILGALLCGVLGIAAFIRVEGRAREPLLPLAFFRDRNFSATLATNGLNSSAYMGALVIAPLLLHESFGFSITQAAFLMALRTASLTLASPVGGALGERYGERFAAAFGCGVMTLALLGVALGAWQSSLWLFAVGLVGQGAGHGLSQPSVTSAVAHSVRDSDLGVAAAANRLAGQGGASFGIVALTLVYGGVPAAGAFGLAFLLGAALSGASTLTALGMGGRARAQPALPDLSAAA